MHIIFLLLIIPIVALAAALAFGVLILVLTAIVEFPATLAGLIVLGWFAYYNLGKFAKRQGVICQQM